MLGPRHTRRNGRARLAHDVTEGQVTFTRPFVEVPCWDNGTTVSACAPFGPCTMVELDSLTFPEATCSRRTG